MWYKKIINEVFIYGHHPNDDVETKNHKTILTIALIVTALNLFAFSFLYINIERYGAAITLIAFGLYVSIILILFKYHCNFKKIRNSYFIAFYFYLIIYHCVMGGYIGSVQYIYYGIPALTGIQLFYKKNSEKYLWLGVYILTSVVLYILEPTISIGMVPLPDKLVILTFVNNFILISTLVFVSVQNFTKIIQQERQKSDVLIRNILPENVVKELNESGESIPIYAEFATVIFIDFVNFTTNTSKMTPQAIVSKLNNYFTNFDKIFKDHGVEKLKTIGDGYMAVGGVPVPNNTHPVDVAMAAIKILQYMEHDKVNNDESWEVRIGIHTGSMVAGIIGKTKFAYDVWGNNVNLGSRLETAGKAGFINVSENFVAFTAEFFEFEDRGLVEIKHGEKIKMFFLLDFKEELRTTHFQPNEKFYKKYAEYSNAPFT